MANIKQIRNLLKDLKIYFSYNKDFYKPNCLLKLQFFYKNELFKELIINDFNGFYKDSEIEIEINPSEFFINDLFNNLPKKIGYNIFFQRWGSDYLKFIHWSEGFPTSFRGSNEILTLYFSIDKILEDLKI